MWVASVATSCPRRPALDRWGELELFVEVAETGSLSRAAAVLGLSNAAASRHLSALEGRLDARLVERNTRRLYLTDTGQAFFARARAILADAPVATQSLVHQCASSWVERHKKRRFAATSLGRVRSIHHFRPEHSLSTKPSRQTHRDSRALNKRSSPYSGVSHADCRSDRKDQAR